MRYVMVSGSRTWEHPTVIEDVFREYNRRARGAEVTLIHGGAKGADQLAAAEAKELGWSLEQHNPDWEKYGRRAGILRNLVMLELNPEWVFIFWDGKSRGTKHVIDECRRRNLNHTLVKAVS